MSDRPTRTTPLATRTPHKLSPDPRRVITRLFVPGEELPDSASRAAVVVERILAMGQDRAAAVLRRTMTQFDGRHPGLTDTFTAHFEMVSHRIPSGTRLSKERRLLIGAYFTQEYAVEAAALFNPSMVAHPDQDGVEAGQVRFLMSARAVGEGHLSSIEFRTGMVGPGTRLSVDDPGRFLVTARRRPAAHDRTLVRGKLGDLGYDDDIAASVLDAVPPLFSTEQLEAAVRALHPQLLTRRSARETVERINWVAAANYDLEFPKDTPVAARVIWPSGATESHGMEDARFVRFVEADATVTYYATYTAFDGANVAPQLIQTNDFRDFRVSQMTGRPARNKGMALFPRRVKGRFLALARSDGESTAIAASDDGRAWYEPRAVQAPEQPWELVQIGNCGSPIETSEGWLVLTHGVGPMRVYAIGAILLDLDDPSRVVAKLADPLLVAQDDERDGYVPNVVYSCGALLHGDALVIPYGSSDTAIRFALVHLPDLLDEILHGT